MRHALRVLWSEKLEVDPDVYEFQVHVFGAKCSPSCATYALRRCAMDNVQSFPENAIRQVLSCFYVDDYLSSLDDENEAVEITKNVIALCASGGFQLTKWVSTSQLVLESASASEGVTSEIDLDMDESPSSRVLGVHWLVKDDRLFFRLSKKQIEIFTKRTLLSLLCSLFYPLGFLAPFVMRAA